MTTSADQARASLGIRLRDIRRDAGLSGVTLAELAGWLSSKVSKIEHGKQTPSEEDLRIWCEHCRAACRAARPDRRGAEHRDAVRRVAAHRAQRHEAPPAGVGGRRTSGPGCSASTSRGRAWPVADPRVRRGGVVELHRLRARPDDAEEGAAARLERQRVLTHGDRRFHMVLGQQALHTNVGGPEVTAGQLEHLLAVLTLPRMRLGVIAFDAPYRVPLDNGFWIWTRRSSSSTPTAPSCRWSGRTRSRCTGEPSSGWRHWPSTARKPGDRRADARPAHREKFLSKTSKSLGPEPVRSVLS